MGLEVHCILSESGGYQPVQKVLRFTVCSVSLEAYCIFREFRISLGAIKLTDEPTSTRFRYTSTERRIFKARQQVCNVVIKCSSFCSK